jgi:alcohol dehydrogenase (cytochrome c)
VVGDTMYVVSPFPNRLFAFDLNRSGDLRWVFDPQPDSFAQDQACCDITNRGAAFAKRSNGQGIIIYSALDTAAIAVDAATGREVWRTNLGDPHVGQTMTIAPLVVGNKAFFGLSGGELGVRGVVMALDVETGGEVWRAYNTGPDADVKIGARFRAFYPTDQGTNLGSTTWGSDIWEHGGATVWGYLTYDPELNLMFYGTSNAAPWNPDVRPGDNKWSAAIFARDPDTGEAVWAYQFTPHDSWDYDSTSENTVVDLPINGVTRRLIVHIDKNGFAYTLDRATGQVLLAPKFRPETNWAFGIDLATGRPRVNPAKQTKEGVNLTDICPSPSGGKEFSPAAFSPITGFFYVPTINQCMDYEALKVNYIAATPFMGVVLSTRTGPGGNAGEFMAWDAARGVKVWGIPEPLSLRGGALVTAANLVFYGTQDGLFKAVDATTGNVLFQARLTSGSTANPMTFLGPDGKQRVAIYSGLRPSPNPAAPAVPAGAVHVFTLP